MTYDHFIFASYGNDSIALIQWAYEKQLKNVAVIHSDTGWASPTWEERVTKAEQWVEGLSFHPLRTVSIGMEALVKQKKAWPRNGMQFCTEELKIKPAKQLMNQLDPNKEAICLVGVRREESQARRAWPEWTEESDKHDGRSLWAPLVNLTAEARDNLVIRAGFEVLPTRSQECCPCVNANREDQRQVPEVVISIEAELGISSTGKPKTMFRPKSKMGAVGIVEVIRWAKAERGKYLPIAEEPDVGNGSGCDSGFCGG